jgi:hypothetical protein
MLMTDQKCTCPTLFDLVFHHSGGDREDRPELQAPSGLTKPGCRVHDPADGKDAEDIERLLDEMYGNPGPLTSDDLEWAADAATDEAAPDPRIPVDPFWRGRALRFAAAAHDLFEKENRL